MLKVIFLLLVSFISLFATDLDSKIELLKTAPKEQRYKIMNEIKQELVKLNESQREHMMQKLFRHKKGFEHHKMQNINNHRQEHIQDKKHNFQQEKSMKDSNQKDKNRHQNSKQGHK